MLTYYGDQPCITALIHGIEEEGRICSALVAPHFNRDNLETPGGSMAFAINNHSIKISASVMTGPGLISVSDKLVVVNFEHGSVLTDVRPRGMPAHQLFKHLAIAEEKG